MENYKVKPKAARVSIGVALVLCRCICWGIRPRLGIRSTNVTCSEDSSGSTDVPVETSLTCRRVRLLAAFICGGCFWLTILRNKAKDCSYVIVKGVRVDNSTFAFYVCVERPSEAFLELGPPHVWWFFFAVKRVLSTSSASRMSMAWIPTPS
jgi:hypothetical protein